jgi:hypothetical protein
LRIEFKRKAVVHLDQHNTPIASVSLADNGSVHTVAINALTVFDVVHTHRLLAPVGARNTHYLRVCKVLKVGGSLHINPELVPKPKPNLVVE